MKMTLAYIGVAMLVALVISVTVRLVAEAVSGDHDRVMKVEGELEAMSLRMERIETKQHPSTARRFTMDHGLTLAKCIDQPHPQQRLCAKRFQLDNR